MIAIIGTATVICIAAFFTGIRIGYKLGNGDGYVLGLEACECESNE